jgi:sirohydrochlorin cobaltochelatase
LRVSESFSDAALVVVGHGTSLDPDSARTVRQHAAELRRRNLFAQVRDAFWKQEPRLVDVLTEVESPRIFIVPFFISEGYFCEQIIPQTLGFKTAEAGPWARVRTRGSTRLFYCKPAGTHPRVTDLLINRAREVLETYPFPRARPPAVVSLFIAAHGTERDEKSKASVEEQVRLIRSHGIFAEVQAVFLEEEPRVNTCYATARTDSIVVVPFFASEGPHVKQDIPVLLGEPERIVQQRLASGNSAWRNPSEKSGKLVWCARALGTDPSMADLIVDRVREAAAFGSE